MTPKSAAAAETGPTGRVCPYARQTCTIQRGCPTFEDELPWDALVVELRAHECANAGSSLYADEVLSGLLSVDHADLEKRTQLRPRRVAQLVAAIQERTARNAAAATAAPAQPKHGRKKAKR
jgi:hypothetical protein